MNRQIKFRVWDTFHKQWIGACAIESDGTIIDIHNAMPETNCIAQQYTGLKDKNGKEIFEGDIVKTIYDDELSTGVVMYNCELGAYRIKTKKHLLPIVTHRFVEDKPIGLITVADKVIGNIFENPELLT